MGATLLLAGCGGRQNTLEPASHPARQITRLWWVMLAGASVGFSVVVALLALGWLRRHREGFLGGDAVATGLVIALGVVVPVVALSALFIWSDIFVTRSTAAPSPRSTSMTIRVIGRQWFWEVRYPGTRAVTANEIHIPVRTRVNVVGTTSDVIHSFWVPALNRKVDLIPGRTNRVLLEADRPGTYRGQCAEFCGLQHAHMALYVIAEPKARFEVWLANTAKPARAPASDLARRGRSLFAEEGCADCHAVRGTAAAGRVGPDLTHLRTRTTLGAVTIPNTPDYLRRWVADPQHYKPGNRMPGLLLTNEELSALVAYLEGLR